MIVHGKEFVLGSQFFRRMSFPVKGDECLTHRHNFPHTTFINRGALIGQELVEDPDGDVLVMETDAEGKSVPLRFRVVREALKRATDGFNFLHIKAGTWHRFIAVEDSSEGYCIFSHRNPLGEVVPDYDGWSPGYA